MVTGAGPMSLDTQSLKLNVNLQGSGKPQEVQSQFCSVPLSLSLIFPQYISQSSYALSLFSFPLSLLPLILFFSSFLFSFIRPSRTKLLPIFFFSRRQNGFNLDKGQTTRLFYTQSPPESSPATQTMFSTMISFPHASPIAQKLHSFPRGFLN